jgi:hypothetical protein
LRSPRPQDERSSWIYHHTEHARRSTLDELADWTASADKLISY